MRVVRETNFAGISPAARGKVRDIYDLGDKLLIVASDRLSAFDVVLPTGIPDKGRVLTQLSLFWFDLLRDVIPNHVLSATEFPAEFDAYRDELAGRSMVVRKTQPLPIECVVRGYVSGSGWKDYRATGKICGIELPAGLRNKPRHWWARTLPSACARSAWKFIAALRHTPSRAELSWRTPNSNSAYCPVLTKAAT